MGSPPTRPAQRARYELRRREVVNAAARVFAERGYHATSIEDLVKATGLQRGGLYHYTASKEDLLLGILDELIDPLLQRAREIVAETGSPETQLRQIMRAWLEHIATHQDHMIVFSQERATLQHGASWTHVRATRSEFEAILAEVLRRGHEDGSFLIADPQLALLALLGTVNYTAQWLSHSGRLRPEEIADGYCNLLLDGIRQSPIVSTSPRYRLTS